MAKITGGDKLLRKLKSLDKATINEVGEALFAAGEVVKAEARVSITSGAVSGKNHVPSLPGHPPSNDTGVLASNINTIQLSPLHVEVESTAPYAVALEEGSERKKGSVQSRSFSAKSGKQGPIRMEFGGSRTEPRPYMGPAAQRSRKEVFAIVTEAVNRALRKA